MLLDLLTTELEVIVVNVETRELLRKLCLLAWKCGFEAGTLKRALQDANISWGFFIDHNPFEPHCNAHPNNFIILPSENEKLLAPVDFDMSFEASEFISTVEPSLGTNDVSLFENWLNSERVILEQSLAGQENMGNFSYSTESPEHLISIAVRDLVVLGYRQGFDRRNDLHSCEREVLNETIQLCLAQTSNIVDY